MAVPEDARVNPQKLCITRYLNISAQCIRKPEQIIAAPRSHTSVITAPQRMPPMLHIPLLKLVSCVEKNLLSHHLRLCKNKGQTVLKLIPETERT